MSLSMACWDLSEDAALRMILEADDVNEASAHHCGGYSPLWYAASGDRPLLVRALYEAGADIDAQDEAGQRNTPLHGAILCGSIRYRLPST